MMKIIYFLFKIVMATFLGVWTMIAVIGVSGTNAEITGSYVAINGLVFVGFLYFVSLLIKSIK